ncbi:ABC transporter, permease protein [Oceanicola granulosus HTCC2516]|uniref:ABC transporter, permease protein n=1 Tax=Oceanicola granulosus (strain ATCC BAA-861 / DSM 15982 / KCTC 12143 / HTCC2516) TaxID=314256 RepID=Q2CJY7_OCEGH|nr:ABC transporter permease [Oceanicola granulosus]EAR53002.1 ABC transporter, permease protein [Oceanicola granulosus HTCC2516]
MFQIRQQRNRAQSALGMLELIYHSIVHEIRKGHRHALLGLIQNMLQTMILVATFYFMFAILGLRGNAVRGDFLLYVMSGIFLFICHTKSMGAVLGSEGPTSAMMKHAPMNTVIAVTAGALSALYIQTISLIVVLFIYHAVVTPLYIDQPIAAYGMMLLAWFTGCAVGMVFLAIKPWAPGFAATASQIYARANMIASGKMFLANTLPAYMVAMFDWNPLFHIIDQARGFVFLHYNPHFSNIAYPVIVGIVLLMLGMIGESYTRKHASASWSAGK